MKPNFSFRGLLCLLLVFVFHTSNAADYYWIGGSGDWSDISHWATAPNGTITHSQSPTANDDVYFNFSSFDSPGQVVTLSTDIIFCRSMNWAGVANNPSLQGGSNVTINVYGSLSLDPNMNFNFAGKILFTGNQIDNTINLGTHTAGKDIIFSGMGAWTLTNGIVVDSAFIFNEGTLNTDGQNIDCRYFDSQSTAERTLNLGASVLTVRGATINTPNGELNDGVVPTLRLNAENLSMDPGNSLFILTAEETDIWMEGPGDINFNRVVLSSPSGYSRIIPWFSNGNTTTVPNMNYQELQLFHGTLLNGSPVIETLILQADQRYQFERGQTFRLGTIAAIGNCSQTIVLESTSPGTPTTFNSDNDNTVNFVTLKGIHTEGAGTFSANESIDLGNNDGWIINPRSATDFYWIGNGGNWNNSANWSFSSGGPSSGCLPSIIDDVYFDVNSFDIADQNVNINTENAYCRNMDWTGATNMPTLTGSINNTVRISGSLTWITNMNQNFNGLFSFESEQAGNTITTAGQAFLFNLNFSGISGEWILQDNIYVEWGINLLSGTLRTNNQSIVANSFGSNQNNARSLYLGGSYVLLERHDNRVPIWEVAATNLVLEAGNSTIEMSSTSSALFRSEGSGSIVYNNVILDAASSSLFSQIYFPSPAVAIDSLIFLQGGYISGNNNVNYWEMAAGETYEFVSASQQTITELAANGDCENGLIYLRNEQTAQNSDFIIDNNHTFDRIYVQGIHQTGNGQLSVNNSIDGGYNLNWNFNDGSGRTLYWVGDEGDWSDQASWSLSSGGPGGECLPTPIDDVIFDTNSFSSTMPLITNVLGNSMYCRNMTWETGINNLPSIDANMIEIYGSLLLQSTLDWSLVNTEFKGSDDHTIATNSNALRTVIFNGSGTYTLADHLVVEKIRMSWGTFDSNDFNVVAEGLIVQGLDTPKLLRLRNSEVEFYGGSTPTVATFQASTDGFNLEAGNSAITFTDPTGAVRTNYELQFHNVTFASPLGVAMMSVIDANFNSLTFNGSGTLLGNMTTDTLFCAPGKSYVFESGETQTINEYWQIIGNNCTPIELSSSIIGITALVEMPPSGEILADFIQMRDISAIGGANFLAGARSTDIANSNTGWTFESIPAFIDVGFLGPDLAICNDEPLEISAYNFSVGESYLWQDGTMDSLIVVDQPGFYSVAVTFLSNCVIQDTIEVVTAQNFNVDLTNDPELCSNESIIFDADIGIDGASYLWQDGSTASSFTTNSAGQYSVVVTVGNCSATDTTQVSTNSYPAIDLGPDLNVCAGNDFLLNANATADTYLWQDGSTTDSFSGDQPGIYWLEAANGSCTLRDSIVITYVPLPQFSLGADTLLCDQNSFDLTTDLAVATYLWSDSSTNTSFSATETGLYWLEATVNGCSSRDSIMLDFQDTPTLDLDASYNACLGETFSLSTLVTADSYLWSNGNTGSVFNTETAGTYSLASTFGVCTATTDFTVNFLPPPLLDLGADQSICADELVLLDAGISGVWQDGSTATTFIATEGGLYFVRIDDGTCTNADSIMIEELPLPTFSLGDDQNKCIGDSVSLTAPGDFSLLSWENGSVSTARTIYEEGLYWLEMEDDNGCINRDSIVLNFAPVPSLDVGSDTTVCDISPYLIQANASEGNLTWSDGSTANDLLVTTTGLVIASLNNQGCITTDSILVQFRKCALFQAYIPNIFSPNDDGINDSFFPQFDPAIVIQHYSMRIFDRWGSLVFESNDPSTAWRGFVRSQLAPATVYVYTIEITYTDDFGTNTEVLKGDVGLVR